MKSPISWLAIRTTALNIWRTCTTMRPVLVASFIVAVVGWATISIWSYGRDPSAIAAIGGMNMMIFYAGSIVIGFILGGVLDDPIIVDVLAESLIGLFLSVVLAAVMPAKSGVAAAILWTGFTFIPLYWILHACFATILLFAHHRAKPWVERLGVSMDNMTESYNAQYRLCSPFGAYPFRVLLEMYAAPGIAIARWLRLLALWMRLLRPVNWTPIK